MKQEHHEPSSQKSCLCPLFPRVTAGRVPNFKHLVFKVKIQMSVLMGSYSLTSTEFFILGDEKFWE